MKEYGIHVNFEDAKEVIDSEPECMILDVREEEEYVTGHAEGAVLFSIDSITQERARQLIPSYDTPLLVYCKTGMRSHAAVQLLGELGYRRIYDMGSLTGWPYGLEY